METEARLNTFAGFRTGTVLSGSVSLLGRNIVLFTSLGAIASAPEFLNTALSADAGSAADSQSALLSGLLPGALATAIMSTLSTAIILYLVLHQVTGRPVGAGKAVAATLARFPSLVGISVLSALALTGLPLLVFAVATALPTLMLALSSDGIVVLVLLSIAPGLILLALWFVAVPVCVIERRGVFQSIARSAALTKGVRSKVFALVLLEMALTFVSGTLVPDAFGSFVGYWGQTAVQFLLVSLQDAFAGVLVAMTYYELYMAKQGAGPGQIAAVFD